jgi:hypothetical protein
MRKMKLTLDALAVESFPTQGRGAARGTVNAHSGYPCPGSGQLDTCGALCTYDGGCAAVTYEYASCVGTDCGHSCVDDCYTDFCGSGTACGTQNTNCGQETCANPDTCAW